MTAAKPDAQALAGNWLLAGALPTGFLARGQAVAFGLAANFTVSGNMVSGYVSFSLPCTVAGIGDLSSGEVGGGEKIAGTIAPDGTFTLQSTLACSAGPPKVTITGTAPAAAGMPWSGTYLLTNGQASCNGQLLGSFSGDVTAQAIPLLSGTFSGVAPLLVNGSTVAVATPISLSLQQGDSSTGTTTLESGAVHLHGTLAIGGASCLTSGTVVDLSNSLGDLVPSVVIGNNILANIAMNDGSVLHLAGWISALDGSQIEILAGTLTQGTCPKQPFGFITLQKQ